MGQKLLRPLLWTAVGWRFQCFGSSTVAAFVPHHVGDHGRHLHSIADHRRSSILALALLQQRRLQDGCKQRRYISSSTMNQADNSVQYDLGVFDDCWTATALSINPSDDRTNNLKLQCVQGPAPQVLFALNRALSKLEQDGNHHSTETLESIFQAFTYLLKREHRFVLKVNGPRDYEWRIATPEVLKDEGSSEWKIIERPTDHLHTLSIAHAILELVTEHCKTHNPYQLDHDTAKQAELESQVQDLVELALQRLDWTLGTDIRSRSSADAAFIFSLAGIINPVLYNRLSKISELEIRRTGFRNSIPAKYVLQHIEKLAASGAKEETAQAAYRVAAECLQSKEYEHPELVEESDRINTFGLHSDRPLLWLWRFAARQEKPKQQRNISSKGSPDDEQVRNGASEEHKPSSSSSGRQGYKSIDWNALFEDASRPLVIDLGSGMGVSLLGLATLPPTQPILSNFYAPESNYRPTELAGNCNFVGGELSPLLCRYSQGIADRWNVHSRLQFVSLPAQKLLEQVLENYPGTIDTILVQFPTPYRLESSPSSTKTTAAGGIIDDRDEAGNTQLPSSIESEDFMANASLLRVAANVLRKSGGGRLVLQSNCEDVAVSMRNIALRHMTCLDSCDPVEKSSELPGGSNGEDANAKTQELPKRTLEWIRQGGERAVGNGWSSQSILPRQGQTETEVACELQGTPVHRCVLYVHQQ